LCAKFGLTHIDIGAEMRKAAAEDTAFGRSVNEVINQKNILVSDEAFRSVLSKALESVQRSQGIILDGAPRSASQIAIVQEALTRAGRELSKVILIELPMAVSAERISHRFLCFGCGHPYVLGEADREAEQVCQRCGGTVGQRKDDTKEGVYRRYEVFQTQTLPVIEHFETEGLLLRINGEHTPDEVFAAILRGIA
jgi:adenylate kinase